MSGEQLAALELEHRLAAAEKEHMDRITDLEQQLERAREIVRKAVGDREPSQVAIKAHVLLEVLSRSPRPGGRVTPKPCPFCANPEVAFLTTQGEKWGQAQCNACAACGPEVRTGYDPDRSWQRDALKEWDKRLIPDPLESLSAKRAIGQHWLEVAAERIAAGEPEAEVMRDYGFTASPSDTPAPAQQHPPSSPK